MEKLSNRKVHHFPNSTQLVKGQDSKCVIPKPVSAIVPHSARLEQHGPGEGLEESQKPRAHGRRGVEPALKPEAHMCYAASRMEDPIEQGKQATLCHRINTRGDRE